MEKKQLTTWEAACIITGYGVGGGVMAMPYLAAKNGAVMALIILLASFAASYVLHIMIAELSIKSGNSAQIIELFSKYHFQGKHKKLMTGIFFVVMALVLFTNLAAYISGAAEIICEMLGLSMVLSRLLFYIIAASVVFFGLKVVGVSEKLAVGAIFAVIGVLAVFSLFNVRNTVPMAVGTVNQGLAYFGMVMFAFSAFFSVPQAVKGLDGDISKVKKAVFLGLLNNLILMVVICFCAIISSTEITELAMIGWSRGIGAWAEIAGSVFTILAMLTTYWSISLALSNIVQEQLKWNSRLCWVLATLPSLLLALINIGGFLDFLELAGGAIAIIVAVLVVPTYRNARKELSGSILGPIGGNGGQIFVVIGYVLMAVGNLVSL